MPRLRCNGIDIEYEVSGPPDGVSLLLIAGLGSQLTRWPPELCTALGAAGFQVIRFDNRDVGLSTHLHGAPVPDLALVTAAKRRGETPDLPYTMSDLAADAAGLLDGLGIAAAHVLGVSMGGMVAQTLAIEHPDRLLSLAIMMAQSGNPEMPPADPALIAILGGTPPDAARRPFQDHRRSVRRAIGLERYPDRNPLSDGPMPTAPIVVHHLNDSRSQRILWMLEELEMPYEIKLANIMSVSRTMRLRIGAA